jgi:predicted MFS family arabinose efflux permease
MAGMLLGRALMAAGGGLITPVVASMAVATSTPELRGRALATVFAGLPLAQAVGIPLGTWLSGAYSWRWSFAAIAGVSLATLVAALWKVPRGVRVQPVSLASLAGAFAQRRVLLAVSFIVFFIGSNFTLLTYLAAFLTERFHLDASQLAWVLAVYGSGAFLGNAVGGAMTDRWGAVRTLVVLCMVTMLMLPLITVAALPLPLIALALLVWAVFGWSVHPAQQARLSHLDPARAPILLAVHSAALYAGSWAGSTLGGEVLASGGSRWLGPAGAMLTFIALVSLVLVHVPLRKPV